MKMLLLAVLAAAAFPATAIAGESVGYDVAGESFEGYRAVPKAQSKGLVAILHDWDGVTAYEQKRAEMLAELGYEAFAIDLYGKGNRPEELADKKAETGKLYEDRERMRKLILGGLAAARDGRDIPAVVMGYCFGGAAALELARSGEAEKIAAYATFHGGLKTPEGQGYPDDTAPMLIAHGGADSSVSMEDVAALSAALEKAGVAYEIQIYSGAQHGFTEFGSARYQERADKTSWRAFLALLREHLG